MLEYLWAESESWPRRVLLAPLWLAEGPYRAGACLHRNMYKWGLRRVVRLPPRVISVGNLTVGGSGKTPMVGWLAAELRKRGRKVAILSRGVRGARSAEVVIVCVDVENVADVLRVEPEPANRLQQQVNRLRIGGVDEDEPGARVDEV